MYLLCFSFLTINQGQEIETDTLYYFQPGELINETYAVTGNVGGFGVRFVVDSSWEAYTLREVHVLFDSTNREAFPLLYDSLSHVYYLQSNLIDNTPGEFLDTIRFTLRETSQFYPHWQIATIPEEVTILLQVDSFWITGTSLMTTAYDTTSPISNHSYMYVMDPFGSWAWRVAFDYAVRAVVEKRTLDLTSNSEIPILFSLHQNHPNPFNPATTIIYDLPHSAQVRLVIYDLLGREVARMVDEWCPAGFHSITWNGRTASGREAPSGIYIARLVTQEYSKSIKMLLLK
ncbi:MAG: T9SS type A sorting domain-containing protein [Fidelibacterota bacterium]|nr:MAG: T9SS type A sorting domain-containing protein [Candidatus Neomarinimicrobiota bacterium]